jgi:hypothetical protein
MEPRLPHDSLRKACFLRTLFLTGHYTTYALVERPVFDTTDSGKESDMHTAEAAGVATDAEMFAEAKQTELDDNDDVSPLSLSEACTSARSTTICENQSRNKRPNKVWMHFSDEHVQEVSQKRVLGSQAYILFYDRM